MNVKTLNVFYGSDFLPYKDQERSVHYPVVGSDFQGANDITEIHFYIDRVCGVNTTFAVAIKLPNGKLGSKVLSPATFDSALNENYVTLPISQFITQMVGGVTISLKAYQGDIIDECMNDTKGISTINKNSYGNVVVSNAENVIFTKSKIYPNVGYARLGSTDFYIKPETAVFRLPSDVNKVEWVEISPSVTKIGLAIGYFGGAFHMDYEIDLTDQNNYQEVIGLIRQWTLVKPQACTQQEWDEHLVPKINQINWNSLLLDSTREMANEQTSLRFYDTNGYDPLECKFISDKPIHEFYSYANPHGEYKPYVLGEKKIRDGVYEPESVMYWERGSNLVKGFDFFGWHKSSIGLHGEAITTQENLGVNLVYLGDTPATYYYVQIFVSQNLTQLGGEYFQAPIELSILDARLRCKYIPMSDLKIKYDNEEEGNNTKLYNPVSVLVLTIRTTR